ncbi:hypothetical protein BJX61DRAFT_525266 [Aspergillus egyptiacus]|nr:hypothetical protein BJX61DRAFT_525266 [Aspergillus egyptiacus]
MSSQENQDPNPPGEDVEQTTDGENPTSGADAEKGKKPKSRIVDELPPVGPWGDRAVTTRRAGMRKPPEKDSSLNVRINLDLRADVALELHAVLQGEVTVGLF